MARSTATGRHLIGSARPSASGRTSRTSSNPAAPQGPIISNVSVAATSTTAVVSWDLDMPGTGYVEWGLDTGYGNQTTHETSFNYSSHAQTISGLSAGVTYHFRVRSSGPSFSPVETISGDYSFATGSVGPVITNPNVTNLTTTSATLNWTTDVVATGVADYGTSLPYSTQTTTDSTYTLTSHSFDITGLTANTAYHWRARSAAPSAAPLTTTSGDQTFSTLSGATGTYDAIFTGDATGATDVSSALSSFINSHNGQRIALAVNGIYKCTRVIINAQTNTIIDFRGSQMRQSVTGNWLLGLLSCNGVTINDWNGVGTGYISTGVFDPYQWEHGIVIADGANNIINSPVARDFRGDGVCCDVDISGYGPVPQAGATNTQINNPNLERCARNNISLISGSVAISGGHCWYGGLANIDFEPNNSAQAAGMSGSVTGVDMRFWGNQSATSPAWSGGESFAFAAGGAPGTKGAISVTNCTGDKLRMLIAQATGATCTGNTSDAATTIYINTSSSITYSGNSSNLTRA